MEEIYMNRLRLVIMFIVLVALVFSVSAGCSLFTKDADVTVELERG